MDTKLYRQVLENAKAIARLQPRQDSVYDDTALVTAITALANRIISLENQLASLDIPEVATTPIPAWSLNKLTTDVVVTDLDGATEFLTLSINPNVPNTFVVLDINSISANAAGTSGTLALLIDGVAKGSETFTIGSSSINFRESFIFAISAKNTILSLELTTNTAGRTITINGANFTSYLVANG